MAAKFFTGLPLDGPDPECVRGFGEQALAARADDAAIPKSEVDHSRSAPRNSRKPKAPVPLTLSVRPPAGEAGPGVRREPARRVRGAGRRCMIDGRGT